ncbi:MAG: right-handed parallel beta-helix repeat-containing protein, partial [Candidatus Pacearchaeota archaeon]
GGCAEVSDDVIFVDAQLSSDCSGTYSITNRDCSGSDGDAYNTLWEVVGYTYINNVPGILLNPGDTVFIREGTYSRVRDRDSATAFTIVAQGTFENPVTIKNYGEEHVVLTSDKNEAGSALHTVMRVEGKNVIIDGVDLKGGRNFGFDATNGAENITIKNSRSYDNGMGLTSGFGVGYSAVNAKRIIFDRVESFANGGNAKISGIGLMLGRDPVNSSNDDLRKCKNCVIINSMFHDNYYKWASDTDHGTDSADGVWIGGGDEAVVRNNIFWNNYDDGIDVMSVADVIQGNVFVMNKVNGIKIGVGGGGAHLIENNIALYNGAYGIDDGRSAGSIYANNIAFHNNLWGMVADGSRMLISFNNILYDNNFDSSSSIAYDYMTNPNTLFYSDYNFIGREIDKINMNTKGFDVNSITGNPQFKDVNFNFNIPLGISSEIDCSNPLDVDNNCILEPEEMFSDENGDGKIQPEDVILYLEKLGLGNASLAIDKGIDDSLISSLVDENLQLFVDATIEKRDGETQLRRIYNYQRLIDYLNNGDFHSWMGLADEDILGYGKIDGDGDGNAEWDLGTYEYSEEVGATSVSPGFLKTFFTGDIIRKIMEFF